MALKTIRGTTSVIGKGSAVETPILLNVEDLVGSIIYGDDGNLYYSNGIGWQVIGDGIQGTQGTQGSQGIQGSQGTQGIQGIQGTYGPSLIIIGSILDVSNYTPPNSEQTLLNTAFPGAVSGNGVIDEATGNLWIYDSNTWKNVGQIKGPQGIQGTQGTTGFGLQGIQGTIGSIGLIGPQGIQGTGGFVGIQGATGAQGTQGRQGIQGVQGRTGIGIPGQIGSQGIRGSQGIQGLLGIQGFQGLQGLQGIQGTQGRQGIQGDFGVSIKIIGNIGIANDASLKAAFPAAVLGDAVLSTSTGLLWAYNGTFWLDIGKFEGPQGIQGNFGPQGIIGFQGLQGIQGTQGTFGLQGIQGGRGPIGVSGSQGTFGRQGIQGTSGVTGFGIQGIQGIQGTQGTLGPQGISGNTGVGIQGIQGTLGRQGTIGAQGISGNTGVGLQGIQGTLGTQGTVGRQGIQGFDGPQGIQGFVGRSAVVSWTIKTANYTAVSNEAIMAITTGGTFTITLPSTPVIGNIVIIGDGANFAANPLIVTGGDKLIEGSQTFTLNIQHAKVDFVYDGTGWQAFSNITANQPSNGLVGLEQTFLLMGA